MPANKHRALWLGTAVASVQTAAILFATRAAAAPSDDDPCDLLIGPSQEYCERGEKKGDSGSTAPDPAGALDPLSSLAKGCAKAASWTIDKLAELVNETTKVDFTNPEFLRQYAVVFAASTILTLTIWLLAVAKRAIRG
ncbi:MAG: hypothetical protein ACRDOV_16895, partial [Streptomyces sp.]